MLSEKVKHRRVHDDVVGTHLFGVPREVENYIEVLIGARHDRLGSTASGFDAQLKRPLAFIDAHGKELALLTGDEQPGDAEVVNPVGDVGPKPVLVKPVVSGERREGGRPDPSHCDLSVGLRFTS